MPHTVPLPGGIPPDHREHTEGTTTIIIPNENLAFLNPVQQYNRDLSVAVIRAWSEMRQEEAEARYVAKGARGADKRRKGKGKGKGAEEGEEQGVVKQGARNEESLGAERVTAVEKDTEPQAGPSRPAWKPRKFTILEALSATGLRSIRYAKEIPNVKVVLANDLSPTACEAMNRNVMYNGVLAPAEAASTSRHGKKSGAETTGTEENSTGSAAGGVGVEETSPVLDPEEGAMNGSEAQATAPESNLGRRPGCDGHVKVNEGDACTLMYSHRAPSDRVDVVDLDPYGTAAPFIDAAIGCIADGGLLAVTCTDLAVLAGSQYPEKSFSNYGGVCVPTEYSHEVALRLVLNSLASAAARYGRYITPLLSFSIDFYVRLFVRVDTQATEVKRVASQIGTVYTCSYCHSYEIQPFGRVLHKESAKGHINETFRTAPGPPGAGGSACAECGSTMHLGGPMWLGPIQNTAFAQRTLQSLQGQQQDYGTWARMQGMLTLAAQEIHDPFYFTVNCLHGAMHASPNSSIKAVSALLNAGYKVSRSHAASGSIKTNAPRSFVYDLVREYIKSNPVRMDKISEGSPARRMLAREQTHTIDFTLHPEAKFFDKREKTVLYQQNPAANWGPGSRAKNAKAAPATSLEPAKSLVSGGAGEKRKTAEEAGAVPQSTEVKKARIEEDSKPASSEEDAMNL